MTTKAEVTETPLMKINITLTLSKIMAFVLLFSALALDFITTKSASTFMYAVPFVCSLVLGKQAFDHFKPAGGP